MIFLTLIASCAHTPKKTLIIKTITIMQPHHNFIISRTSKTCLDKVVIEIFKRVNVLAKNNTMRVNKKNSSTMLYRINGKDKTTPYDSKLARYLRKSPEKYKKMQTTCS